MTNPISNLVERLLEIPVRKENVTFWYLFSLLIPASKHSLKFASETSGLARSQFSRFLYGSCSLAISSLEKLAVRTAKTLSANREPLVAGAPWTVGILIDATLQSRSSKRPQNSKKFNHGKGYVLGHQWTNILLFINGQVVPLPPIPFYSVNECERRGIVYKTEHESLIEYFEVFNLADYVGFYKPSEIVVLSDSGYDGKKLQNSILALNWEFVGALKSSRSAQSKKSQEIGSKEFKKITDLFWSNRRYSPWTTVRAYAKAGQRKKRKEFRARQMIGFLKGIANEVKIVCSEERNKRKGRKFLVCSNTKVSLGAVVRVYRLRWEIELFHKDVKSCLGFEDVAVKKFDAVSAHVHWVYCAYLLSKLFFPDISSLTDRQQLLKDEWEKRSLKKIMQLSTRFAGLQAVQNHCQEVLQGKEVA